MEEPEASIKRRKTGEREDIKNGNEMRLPAAKEPSTAPDKKNDTRSPYQMNPKAFERLRQITKDCKKAYVLPKDAKGSDKQNQEVFENGVVPPDKKKSERKNSDDDVIISSVGSSPANSPKPTDLVVLSTSPKKNSPNDSQDTFSSPYKRVKPIGIINENATSLESRKRKFEEVVLSSQNADACSISRGHERANSKCNGDACFVYSDGVKSSVNHSAAPENLVSKVKQTDIVSSSSVNKKCERKHLENGSNLQNEQRKIAKANELQKPFSQCGESLEPAKQATESSNSTSNEPNKRKSVKTVYKDHSTDPSAIQQEGNISLSKEKEKAVLPVKNHVEKSFYEGERSSVKKQLVSSSSTLEKRNEEFTSLAKPEDFNQFESSQQITSSRRTCPDFNSYEFKETLKTLVAERMREMQKSFIGTPQTLMLRIEKLESENRELRSYSKKLEETVKDLLIKQKNKVEGRMCKEVQTVVLGARTPPVTWPPSSSTVSEPSSSLVSRMTSSVIPRTNAAGSSVMTHQIPGKYVQQQDLVQPLNPPLPKVPNEVRIHSLASQPASQPFSSHGAAVTQPVALRNLGPMTTNRQRPVTATVHPQPTTVVSNPPSRPPPPPYNSPRVAYPSVRPPAPHPGMQMVCSVPGPVHSTRPVMQVNQSPGLVQPQPGQHGVPQLRAQIAPTQRINVSVGAPPTQPPLLPSSVVVQPSRATQPPDPSFVQSTPNHIQPTQEMIIDRRTSPQTPYSPQANFQGPPQVIPRAVAQGLHRAPPLGPQQGMIRVPPPVSIKTQTSAPRPPKVIPQGPSQQHSHPPGFQNNPPSGGLSRGPQPGLAMVRPPQQNFTPPSIEVNPATDDGPPEGQSPVEAANTAEELPPKPTVSIAVVMSGIVLSWNMNIEENCAQIVSYQLFALQDNSSNSCQPTSNNPWKKIGVVKALPLPMACTLTQFLSGNRYHFMVRAVDKYGRTGSFSDPCTITLS